MSGVIRSSRGARGADPALLDLEGGWRRRALIVVARRQLVRAILLPARSSVPVKGVDVDVSVGLLTLNSTNDPPLLTTILQLAEGDGAGCGPRAVEEVGGTGSRTSSWSSRPELVIWGLIAFQRPPSGLLPRVDRRGGSRPWMIGLSAIGGLLPWRETHRSRSARTPMTVVTLSFDGGELSRFNDMPPAPHDWFQDPSSSGELSGCNFVPRCLLKRLKSPNVSIGSAAEEFPTVFEHTVNHVVNLVMVDRDDEPLLAMPIAPTISGIPVAVAVYAVPHYPRPLAWPGRRPFVSFAPG